jgi:hypothetical protein
MTDFLFMVVVGERHPRQMLNLYAPAVTVKLPASMRSAIEAD